MTQQSRCHGWTRWLRTDDLDYDLPRELIATRPAEPRDACRLLVVSRSDPSVMEHARFADLPGYLRRGDVMVFNTSGVLPARLIGVRRDSGGAVEGLFLGECASDTVGGRGAWRVMLKSNGKLRAGQVIVLGSGERRASIELIERDAECWVVRPDEDAPASTILARVGATPLPPYILRQRKQSGETVDDASDRDWYQTVYAQLQRETGGGSVAAPTAGLHFTEALLGEIERVGVVRADVRLDVGAGTFKPIESERTEDHPMHAEWARVPGDALGAMDYAPRVIAVGTTSVRAAESVPTGHTGDWEGWTDLMIGPGYTMKRIDALVTNFHLPRSTLLMLAGALFPEGVERVKAIYAEAVRERYRFYSYGDAMLILP